jgi:ribosomal protein S18 acetylase RimI-like enzyme
LVVQLAESDVQILECFPTLLQLRPRLKQETFVEDVRRQQNNGYQLAYITVNARVVAVAGFCISECFAWGRFLYVYDLAVDATVRSQGHGQHLFGWLVEYAKAHDCQELSLDSGVQRFDAHRFYLRQRMNISSHHFSLSLA